MLRILPVVLALILLPLAAAYGENWVYLGDTNEGHAYYLDTDLVSKSAGDEYWGPTVTAWMKTIYSTEEPISGMQVKRELVKVAFDCDIKALLIMEMRFYDKDDNLIDTWDMSEEDTEMDIPPGSFTDLAYQRVCY